MVVIQGRNVNETSNLGSVAAAMTTLTPTRAKTMSKSGKMRRMTRRTSKDLLERSDDDEDEADDDEHDGTDEQGPPSAKAKTKSKQQDEEPAVTGSEQSREEHVTTGDQTGRRRNRRLRAE
ncbi:hypothetical protein ON010_g18297 [Phytophthora cinnamomi]|nr:hypothetical protein ON010_g18297 [Phytophthora cinnamomi]